MLTDTDTDIRLAPRRTVARVGAVDEYIALHRAAIDRLVQHGLEAAAATVRLRTEARNLAPPGDLDDDDVPAMVGPVVAATEAAIAEVHEELHRLTAHVLRMTRYRLGLS